MKETKEELKKLLWRLENLIDNFPFDVWFKDVDGKYMIINKYYESYAGRKKEELIGKCDYDIYPKQEADLYVASDQKAINGKIQGYYEYEYQPGRFKKEFKKPIFDESGKLIGTAGFCQDITDQKLVYNALIDSERSKAILISNLPGVAYRCIYDEDLTITFISEGCGDLTGYTSEELLNKNPSYYDLILPEYRSLLFEKWSEDYGPNVITPDEYQIKTASGQIKWVWEQYQEVYDANIDSFITEGLIIDITERKMAEKALAESEERFRTIFEEAPLGIGIFDSLTGKAHQVNNRYIQIMGRPKKEIMSLHWAQYTHPDDVEASKNRLSLMIDNRQSGFSINKRYLKPNGSIIWANVTIAPYDYGIDSNPCYLCMVEDITEQKLRDLALREAEERERLLLKEAVEFKDSFITLITHEFKTPITIINAALQTMEIVCKRDITNSMMKYLNKIKQNSLRQQRLVDNLLDVTRIKAGRFNINPKYVNVFSITKEIVESVEVFALQKGISLMFYSNVESEIILIDWQIYERIVLNLLSNAVKFSPENGKIYIRLSVNNDRLKFRVRDQGLGIPIDKQRVIFEQFGQVNSSFSRQAEGTGIGLYLVKLLVDELKGAISLKSYEKKGSIFTVTLPIQDFTISETSQAVQLDSVKQIANKEFSDIINVGTIC